MAFKSMGYLRSMLSRLRGTAAYTTATTSKQKAYVLTADDLGHKDVRSKVLPVKGDFVPVYVALGMIALSTSLGLYTGLHELKHAPNVRVRKKLRETIPEVYDPDRVVDESEKFLTKSFFRKVAHVQGFESGQQAIPDHMRKDVFAHPPKAETLKDVGINPKEVEPPIKLP